MSACLRETRETRHAGVAARVTAWLDESASTDISPGRLEAYAAFGAAESREEVGDEMAHGVLQREAGDLGALRY